jgi:hypothetical protein
MHALERTIDTADRLQKPFMQDVKWRILAATVTDTAWDSLRPLSGGGEEGWWKEVAARGKP